MGSFLREPVKKGEILMVQGGRIIHQDLLDEPAYEPYGYHCFQVEREFYICPIELERESADAVFDVNHSCDPTAGFQGQITLISLRDLEVGEEITFDYAMTDVGTAQEGWEDMECQCGSEICRKKVGGSDWRILELQERYAGYFSPYVQRLINEENA